jgi:hypothetical protein
MKKLIASVLSGVLLAIACAGLANAAVLDRDTPAGSALVHTSCEVDYSVVIPADMEIPFGSLDTEIGRVYADVMKIEKGKAVYVEVDSQKAYNLVNTANAAHGIAYALAGADAICFNRVNDPTQFPLNALIEQKTWDAAYAGDYEDTLLFTITYR